MHAASTSIGLSLMTRGSQLVVERAKCPSKTQEEHQVVQLIAGKLVLQITSVLLLANWHARVHSVIG